MIRFFLLCWMATSSLSAKGTETGMENPAQDYRGLEGLAHTLETLSQKTLKNAALIKETHQYMSVYKKNVLKILKEISHNIEAFLESTITKEDFHKNIEANINSLERLCEETKKNIPLIINWKKKIALFIECLRKAVTLEQTLPPYLLGQKSENIVSIMEALPFLPYPLKEGLFSGHYFPTCSNSLLIQNYEKIKRLENKDYLIFFSHHTKEDKEILREKNRLVKFWKNYIKKEENKSKEKVDQINRFGETLIETAKPTPHNILESIFHPIKKAIQEVVDSGKWPSVWTLPDLGQEIEETKSLVKAWCNLKERTLERFKYWETLWTQEDIEAIESFLIEDIKGDIEEEESSVSEESDMSEVLEDDNSEPSEEHLKKRFSEESVLLSKEDKEDSDSYEDRVHKVAGKTMLSKAKDWVMDKVLGKTFFPTMFEETFEEEEEKDFDTSQDDFGKRF